MGTPRQLSFFNSDAVGLLQKDSDGIRQGVVVGGLGLIRPRLCVCSPLRGAAARRPNALRAFVER